MKNIAARTLLWVAAAFAYAGQVEAHTFGAEGAGMMAGIVHPFGGLDHLLAMLGVGIWAAQLGGSGTWRLPLVFVGVMSFSALLAAYGPAWPMLEAAIALSVLVLGGLILSAARLPVGLGALMVGVLAIGHGYAHGLEIPEADSALLYGAGFVISTASLHLIGILFGLVARHNCWLSRVGGFAIAVTGVYLTATVV